MCHRWFSFSKWGALSLPPSSLQTSFQLSLSPPPLSSVLGSVFPDEPEKRLAKTPLYCQILSSSWKTGYQVSLAMDPTGCYLHATLLAIAIFSWLPQAKANATSLWVINSTEWEPILQNQTNRSEDGHPTALGTPGSEGVNTPGMAEARPSFAPPSGPDLTPSPKASSTPTAPSAEHTSRSQSDIFRRDICDESNNKMAMLVCLIIIAVLFLICTLLFLSTVILANRVSSLKRAKQVCKRQTRSNGDFLASSGLWLAESNTGKRAEQLTGPRLMLQATGTLTLPRERKDDGASEKLAQ
ncbi:protein EVI2A [Petaurus breviceps papuanus]|uniref:protein EVI2A n=1 Tax=Petaurus breviceps papuanus TaxID=3040969 RepID=UPI0036DCB12B